jgi:NitT/TauT family transport system substrate-binding protein
MKGQVARLNAHHRGRSRGSLMFGAAAVAAALLAGCASGTSAGGSSAAASGKSLTEVTLVTGGDSMSFAQTLYAVSAGLFADQGIKINMQGNPNSSGTAATLIQSGEVDAGSLSDSSVYAAVAQGRDIQANAMLVDEPVLGVTLSDSVVKKLAAKGVTPTSPIGQRLQALKGLTLSVNGPSTGTYAALVSVLDEAKLQVGKDITLLPVSSHPLAATATQEGQTDGYFAPAPDFLDGPSEGWGTTWLQFSELPNLKVTPWVLFATNTQFAKAHPQTVDALTRALWASAAAFKNDPAQVAKVLKKAWFASMSQNLFNQSFNLIRPTMSDSLIPTPQLLQKGLALYNQYAQPPVHPTFAQVYNTVAVESTKPSS